jgi:hypothetical protein
MTLFVIVSRLGDYNAARRFFPPMCSSFAQGTDVQFKGGNKSMLDTWMTTCIIIFREIIASEVNLEQKVTLSDFPVLCMIAVYM